MEVVTTVEVPKAKPKRLDPSNPSGSENPDWMLSGMTELSAALAGAAGLAAGFLSSAALKQRTEARNQVNS